MFQVVDEGEAVEGVWEVAVHIAHPQLLLLMDPNHTPQVLHILLQKKSLVKLDLLNPMVPQLEDLLLEQKISLLLLVLQDQEGLVQ